MGHAVGRGGGGAAGTRVAAGARADAARWEAEPCECSLRAVSTKGYIILHALVGFFINAFMAARLFCYFFAGGGLLLYAIILIE